MRIFLFILLITFFPVAASALQESSSLSTDYRIREVPYDKNEVYKFIAHYRFQSSIEFEEGEDIRTISVGDSAAWQIIPSGNRIFLKPTDENPNTNMTIVTNRRIYYFELYGEIAKDVKNKDLTFAMRFIYPGELSVQSFNSAEQVPGQDIIDNPEKYNFNYSISGTSRISPIRIFDDGEFTYFQFKDINADLPAFFKVDSEAREAIINFRTVGDYVVVERVTSQFTLRHGPDIVCVFNEASPLQLLPEVRKAIEEAKKN